MNEDDQPAEAGETTLDTEQVAEINLTHRVTLLEEHQALQRQALVLLAVAIAALAIVVVIRGRAR